MTLRKALETARRAPPTAEAVVWKGDTHWLGHWLEWPDYWTQGETPEELESMLRSLWDDLTGGEVPGLRRVVRLDVAPAAPTEASSVNAPAAP